MRVFLILIFFISSLVIAQESKLVLDEDSNILMLVGTFAVNELQDSSIGSWFNSEYSNYEVDIETLKPVIDMFEGKVIKIILGTWCSDSRREVPRFLKILNYVGYPEDKVLIVGVDRDKKGFTNEVDGLEIDFVPTFIIYESGKEIGRIIESPIETLEKDLVEILVASTNQ